MKFLNSSFYQISAGFSFFICLSIFQTALASSEASWTGQVRYGDSIITEDPPQRIEGLYINPNENENYLHARCLDSNDRGVLISVGSMRTLILGALGRFEEIFPIDYDFQVTAVNWLLRGFAKISENRHEFLSYLFTGSIQQTLVSAAVKKNSYSSDRAFIKELIRISTRIKITDYYRALDQLRLSLPDPSPSYAKSLNDRFKLTLSKHSSSLHSLLLRYLYELRFQPQFSLDQILDFFELSQAISDTTIFGKEDLFQHIHKLALNNKITPLLIDLAGEKGLISLARALENKNRQVKALDVSNAHRGIIGNSQPLPDKVNRYFDNLYQLPWSPKGRLLITDEYEEHPNGRYLWKYFALDHRFLPQFTESYLSPVSELGDFYHGLSQWPIGNFGPPTQHLRISRKIYSWPDQICK